MAPAGPHKPGLQGSNPCSASNSQGTGYGRVVTGKPPKKPVLSRLWAMWTSGLCQQNVSLPAGFPGSRVRIPSCAPNSRRRLQNGAEFAASDVQHAPLSCALGAYSQLDRSRDTEQQRPDAAGDLITPPSSRGRTSGSDPANGRSNRSGGTNHCRVAQSVERHAVNVRAAGSSPAPAANYCPVAQSVEQAPDMRQVGSSILPGTTNLSGAGAAWASKT